MDSSETERTIGPPGGADATPGAAPADPRPAPGTRQAGPAPTRGTPPAEFHFDFVDPRCYVVGHMIDRAGAGESFSWRGLELRPPPASMVDPGVPAWRSRHAEARSFAQSLGVPIAEPAFLPWTRKAHELCEFARERGRLRPVRRALFRSHFVDRSDIGRIDSLVEIAHGAGLDRTEAKAVLDVDRYAETVARNRETALERGIRGVPTLVTPAWRLDDTASLREIERLLTGWIANGR